MENHPIPQDVTGFKFKLIGSVTIKQFLYLLAAGILTVLVFILPINIIIKIPFMATFVLTGLGLAFVPIEGRPMDTMIMNFVKAIPSENRYIYKKKGANIASFEYLKPPVVHAKVINAESIQEKSANDSKREILLKRLRNSSFKPDEEEQKFFKNVKSYFDEGKNIPLEGKTPIFEGSQTPIEPPRIQNLPDKMPEVEKIEIETAPVALPQSEEEATEEISSEQNIQPMQEQTTARAAEDVSVRQETQDTQPTPDAAQEAQTQSPIQTEEKNPEEPNENVKFITPQTQLQAGFPSLPDIPNVVLGIIKDPRGKVLPNILVEVFDSNNVPVRAFKTNALGQFASATPLQKGNYKMVIEDQFKKNEFEPIEFTLAGEICNPFEITSVDAREKLRRELFEGNAAQPAA